MKVETESEGSQVFPESVRKDYVATSRCDGQERELVLHKIEELNMLKGNLSFYFHFLM